MCVVVYWCGIVWGVVGEFDGDFFDGVCCLCDLVFVV